MKKYIIGLIVGIVLAIPAYSIASTKQFNWWSMGNYTATTRFYDDDNNLVCWVVTTGHGISVDCEKIKLTPSNT